MKTIKVFVVDEHNEVVEDNSYKLIKMINDSIDISTMFVVDLDGDFSLIKAFKDYSVDPFRYIVRRKMLIPFWFEDKEENIS